MKKLTCLMICFAAVVLVSSTEAPAKDGYDVAAFYWPSLHYDKRWAEFFPDGSIGEWESIRNCKPKWEGHWQPRVPAWGYLMDNDPKAMEKKIDAATGHGVNVMIFDWYWFENKPFLESALNDGFLKAKNVDKMKFYLMWANHDAKTAWDIRRSHKMETIWPGSVDLPTFKTVVARVIKKYFSHPSYYKIDGKPVFSIYDMNNLIKGLGGVKQTVEALDYFRAEVKKAGFPGLHFQMIYWGRVPKIDDSGFASAKGTAANTIKTFKVDSITNYQFVHLARPEADYIKWADKALSNWPKWSKQFDVPYFPHVSIGWDNNARFVGKRGAVTDNVNPQTFKKYLIKAKAYADAHSDQQKLITINAWNEWVEGSYLEPDKRFGMGYLEAVREVFGPQANKQAEKVGAAVEIDDFKVSLIKPIPEKVVVLTFDDACASHATFVGPLLKKYGFGATFYVCEFGKNFNDNNVYMSWDQMHSLHEMGFEIGNHTLSHPGLRGKPLDYCQKQLKAIEDRCTANNIAKPTTFCWPGYSLNKPFYSVLFENGYKFARGGGQRAYDPLKDNPFNTPSFDVKDNKLKDKEYFANAAKEAKAGQVVIFTFHGVPDIEHKWVNTDPERFEECMKYLKDNNYTVIAMRDLSKYIKVEKKTVKKYSDGRPSATLRMDAKDHGVVLRHGDGPDKCDILGAREALIYEENGVYHLFYDGAGPKGWLACLATSKDLKNWQKKGPVLDFGKAGEMDSAAACSPWIYKEGGKWHMFYLGTPNVSPKPNLIPSFPYLTMKASASKLSGPWIKQKDVIPFRTKPGTYYSMTASPGDVVKSGDEYLQFFSSTTRKPSNSCVQRTLGIARTKDLDGSWTVDPKPMVPIEEQVENSSLYYEKSNKTWFLFTNHIGIDKGEYTDAIWVYWTKDLNKWDPKDKAVVLDGVNCTWSKKCIGMPSVIRVGDRLAIFYDAPGGNSISHMNRNIGLAWLDLPLKLPKEK